MRITRSTVVFFVVCVAVIIAMLVFLNTPASAPTGSNVTPTPAVTVRLFPDLTPENLARIGVIDTIGEAETVFIKQADTSWKVDTTTTDTTGDVTQDAIEESARLLAELTAESFPAEGRSLADFGLDTPAYTISFTTDAGAAKTFKLGHQNSTNRSYYALLNDDVATIYLLSSANRITTLIGYAGQPPYVPVPTATPQPSLQVPGVIFPQWTGLDVTRFELRDNVSKDVLIITRNEDDTWSIAEATNSQSLPVSQELIQVVINSFGYIPDTAAVEDVDPAAIGLDKPAYTVSGFTDGITAYQLQIGDSDVSGKLYYVKVNDIPQIALIDKGALDALLNLIVEPPYAPEATPEATSESTAEATAEATVAS